MKANALKTVRSQMSAGLLILRETGEPFFTCQEDRQVSAAASRADVRVSTVKMLVVDPRSAQTRRITHVLPGNDGGYKGMSLHCSRPLPVGIRLLKACERLKITPDKTRELLNALRQE